MVISGRLRLRLWRAGELQKDVLDLILLNCQVPQERLSDLRAQRAANRVGVQRFQALAAKYGVATVLGAGEALMDYAERKMRAAIAALPDGTWRFEDVFDNEEVPQALPMSVEITVAGDRIRRAVEPNGLSVEEHAAGVERIGAEDRAREFGAAGAQQPGDPDDFPRAQFEADALHPSHASRIAHVEISHRQQRRPRLRRAFLHL